MPGKCCEVGRKVPTVLAVCEGKRGTAPAAGGLVSRVAVSGSVVAAELRPCEGSGQDDGHSVILAAHPVWDDGAGTSWLASARHRAAALRGCRKMAVAGSASCYPAGRLAV